MMVAHRHDEPEKLVAAILAELDRFFGARPPDDDITIVVMKVAA
jgi:serine phosphatase RsbU (regulator of sigma subunit)